VAVLASLDIGLRNPSETASAAVPVPAQRREIPRPLPARIDTGGTATGAAPAPDASPTRPAAALAMAALTDASPAPASLVVPGGLSSVVPVAFPWPPAAEEPGLPGAEALFVRLAVPQTVPEAEAEEIASLLREIGVGDSRVTRVGFKVSETHVRFYRPADAPAAAALAEMLGTEARDHSTFRPRPPDGTLEVFLAGERTAPPPRVSTSRTTRRQPPDELTRMRDRIVNRLRRGEHL
jgi:hypothetical protein